MMDDYKTPSRGGPYTFERKKSRRKKATGDKQRGNVITSSRPPFWILVGRHLGSSPRHKRVKRASKRLLKPQDHAEIQVSIPGLRVRDRRSRRARSSPYLRAFHRNSHNYSDSSHRLEPDSQNRESSPPNNFQRRIE